jgi:hypothetical protein
VNRTRTHLVAVAFLLALSGLVAAGCHAHDAAGPAFPGLPGPPPKWSCEAERGDDECLRCMRSSCCDVASVCFDDDDCAIELACSLRQRFICPGGSPRGTRKTVDVLSCQHARCGSCPKIKGDTKS